MRITFLGTGTSQGVPPIGCSSPVCLSEDTKDKRLRASILVEWKGKNIVVDAGPDFRYQLIRAGVQRLDALLFTHEHRDHTAGLDDIRPFNYLQNGPVEVYCSQRVLTAFKSQYDYIFSDYPYPGIPLINFNLIDNGKFLVDDCWITAVEVMHYKLPVHAFVFDEFAYVTDANFISTSQMELLRNKKVLVLNALRKEAHISHFTLDEAVAMGKELSAEKVYFTHMSHQIGFHEEVNKQLPSNMALAFDGQVVELN
jgi:phosphoribosyl 1,2-cyclic phosphate phosphodiesterase